VKIRSIKANNHKRAFDVTVSKGVLPFPYAKADPAPTSSDPIVRIYVDDELGREGFTYVLLSGDEGSVHVDSVLEYNEDPAYMRDLLLYELTLRAQQCMKASPLSQTEILRRAKTSASQASRLLDTANRTKSVDKLLVLLAAMDCEVEFSVRSPRAHNNRRAVGSQARAGVA
jgi:predicted XRE-type DNA-binding protein